MALPRTAFALDEIQAYLREAPPSPLIENYLVQFLLVSFYCEVEERVKEIMKLRLDSIEDRKVASFINRTNENMFKRVKKAEINDVLQKFGCGEGDIISTLVEENLQPYHDAITNRHLVSHQGGTDMTIGRIQQAMPCADAILKALEVAIARDEAD